MEHSIRMPINTAVEEVLGDLVDKDTVYHFNPSVVSYWWIPMVTETHPDAKLSWIIPMVVFLTVVVCF